MDDDDDDVFVIPALTAGVAEDVEHLVKRVTDRFDEHENLYFEHFVAAWQEMKFGLVRCCQERIATAVGVSFSAILRQFCRSSAAESPSVTFTNSRMKSL